MFVIDGCSRHQSSDKAGSTQASIVSDTPIESSLIIPVTIQNNTYKFIVDTGASLTVIDKKLAEKLTREMRSDELPEVYRDSLQSIIGVNSQLEKQKYTLVKPVPFSIGNEIISDNEVWIATDLNLFSQAAGQDISGFIGIDTIRKLNWLVDNKKKRLVITKDAPSAREWQQCTGYEDSYNRAPLLWFSFGKDEASFRIDTGASGSYVSTDFIDFLKSQKAAVALSKASSRHVDISGNHHSDTYILKGLAFNDMALGEMKASESSSQLYAVGMDFLSRFPRYAILPSRMMFCFDADSIERHGLTSQRSFSIRYTGNHIELFYNSDDDLKDTGLRNGDILLTINGITYPPAKIDTVRTILDLTPKGKLTLLIQRGQQRQEVHL